MQWENVLTQAERGLGHRGGYSPPELLVPDVWAVLGDFVTFKDIAVHLFHLEWCSNCMDFKSYFLISHSSRCFQWKTELGKTLKNLQKGHFGMVEVNRQTDSI